MAPPRAAPRRLHKALPTSSAAPGYSGKPLAAKLGVVAGTTVHALGAPADYAGWLDPLPPGAAIVGRFSVTARFVHFFASERAALARELSRCRDHLPADAVLWVSWPKKSAKQATDITEDTIRDLALPLGWVDVKVCAVSEVWSGLKLVVRKTLR
jgi:hypothetical protein